MCVILRAEILSLLCSHLVLVYTDEGYESALLGTAEDTAIKTHLRRIFGLVGVTESTFVDNMFFCRQKLSLSLLYIFVQEFITLFEAGEKGVDE